MYLTVHAAAGAVIGNYINNAFLAFVLGFLSHFILDRIPHKDPESIDEVWDLKFQLNGKIKKFVSIFIIDVGLLVLMTLFFYNRDIFIYPHPVLAGIAGALLPDIIQGIYYLTGSKYLKKFWRFHNRIHFDHKKVTVSLIGGTVTQVIILAILIRLIIVRFLNYGG